jgi:two-component system, sensor histidine kinase and response regulator
MVYYQYGIWGKFMKKILIIDDEHDNCKLLCDILSAEGYDVLTAMDGMTGIQLAQETLPDLIVSDVNMPDLGGYDVLKALRENPATLSIPFIFLSALGEMKDIRSGMVLGADDYLVKPFRMTDLLAAIRVRFEKRECINREAEERLNELRRNIAYALPHEFRTPLGVVLGYSHLLMEELDPAQAEMIQFIIHSANRLHNLSEKFWTYVETEILSASPGSKEALQKNRIENARPIIEATALEIARHFERESDLAFNLPDASLQISEQHLGQIVNEVTHNAFKFSEPGTEVMVAAYTHAGSYTIAVANVGRGMTAGQIARVGAYMQFERLEHEQKGVGLGLTISRQLAELSGGTLNIQSVPNEQTIVTITLRLADPIE